MAATAEKECPTQDPKIVEEKEEMLPGYEDVNMGNFDISEEKSASISRNFDRLRMQVRREGLMEGSVLFYIRKVIEALLIIALAVYLQLNGWYVVSAVLMGLVWQQLGWLIHEFAHNQLFKSHWHNDLASYVVGNLLQGFSSGGWKEQHNIHHAATNIVGRDGDLDLLPLWATVVQDLKNADNWWLSILPYQHIYWSVMLPLLRVSWLLQSIVFVNGMPHHYYKYYRERAVYEQVSLTLHWILVIAQLYLLPSIQVRLLFFAISQLTGGFLLAHVVTYNHYSVEKFPYTSKIMSNYACLQVHTTRNMRPGVFIDWLWGGLNYQIEHHLFPTMPRHNLSKVMPMVKQFCAENDLPYMVDDYFTGWKLEIEQFANVARIALKMKSKIL